MRGKDLGGGAGAAVPVSRDGYFLTAAHVVGDAESITLVSALADRGGLQLCRANARIVWSPIADESGPDLALLYADMPGIDPFKLASTPPKDGDRIAAAGWPWQHAGSSSGPPWLAGGRVLDVAMHAAVPGHPEFAVVRHDTPLVPGDSGGPLLDSTGNLIAVNSLARWSLSPWERFLIALRPGASLDTLDHWAVAVRPDPRWLDAVDPARPSNQEQWYARGRTSRDANDPLTARVHLDPASTNGGTTSC